MCFLTPVRCFFEKNAYNFRKLIFTDLTLRKRNNSRLFLFNYSAFGNTNPVKKKGVKYADK